jgi:prepilin-type N-terminal cleavage/methylation domain-containing protein
MLSLSGKGRIARRQCRGFTLLEVAIVVLILGLLLGGMLVPLSVQRENRERAETEATLEEVKEALYGFALVNGRLPCPDTDRDGQENIVDSAPDYPCDATEGDLPAADLGVRGVDAWSRPFVYRVTAAFADRQAGTLDTEPSCDDIPDSGVSFALCSAGNIEVRDAPDDAGNAVATGVPAVVVSRGSNWAVTSSDYEAENDGQDTGFVFKTYSRDPATEFDDLLVWLSPHVLKNRMIEAKLLP